MYNMVPKGWQYGVQYVFLLLQILCPEVKLRKCLSLFMLAFMDISLNKRIFESPAYGSNHSHHDYMQKDCHVDDLPKEIFRADNWNVQWLLHDYTNYTHLFSSPEGSTTQSARGERH